MMISTVGAIRKRKEWEKWMTNHLPSAVRFTEELPSFGQDSYPAYQLEAVNIVKAREELLRLLADSGHTSFVTVIAREPAPLAYRLFLADVEALLVEMGRRDEFLDLISLAPRGKLLIEHPAEQTGVAPFWLSAEGSLESLVSRFAERLPGGTLYLTEDYSLDGR